MDLLDAIAEAEAIANGKKELCGTWKGAVKNENGVYVINTHAFPAGSRKDVFLELSVALTFPYVVCELDLESAKDNSYGSYSPLSDTCPMYRFSVYDDPWQVECGITAAINAEILDNRNISDKAKERMLKLVPIVVQKAMESIHTKS